jgi:hypothetical protein
MGCKWLGRRMENENLRVLRRFIRATQDAVKAAVLQPPLPEPSKTTQRSSQETPAHAGGVHRVWRGVAESAQSYQASLL